MISELQDSISRWKVQQYSHAQDGMGLRNADADRLADAYVAQVAERQAKATELGQPIDETWLVSIGGKRSETAHGFWYLDFPIITEFSDSTFLRIHMPDSDGDWSCDLFSKFGEGCAIVNWPSTRGQFLDLMSVLGIEPNS